MALIRSEAVSSVWDRVVGQWETTGLRQGVEQDIPPS